MEKQLLPSLLKSSEHIQELLLDILKSDIPYRTGTHSEFLTTSQREIVASKINALIAAEVRGKCTLVLRGENKDSLKNKLIGKLNSDDSLYDGLFLAGDKAKNYLKKESDIPHPIKRITDVGKETASWIFEEYATIGGGAIDVEYFRKVANKIDFVSKLENNAQLIDYYLFGIHTFESNRLVNFVSTTTTPGVAFSHTSNLIIISWVTNYHEDFCINKKKLITKANEISGLDLPVLTDSFYPNENEYAMKGFILPHYILGVIDVNVSTMVFNPELLEDKQDWLDDGFDINKLDFKKFIGTSNYKRYLMLMDGQEFKEEDIE